jgi:hypothetical protein
MTQRLPSLSDWRSSGGTIQTNNLISIRKKKVELLLADCADIPEIISNMSIKGESGVDELVSLALELYRNIPRCFIRYLRVCCVSSPELTPLPPIRPWEYAGNDLLPCNFSDQDQKNQKYLQQFDQTAYAHAMARQSIRKCLMISPAEFISLLHPISTTSLQDVTEDISQRSTPSPTNGAESPISLESDTTTDTSFHSSSTGPPRLVVLDLR